jgi:hypothetical protein
MAHPEGPSDSRRGDGGGTTAKELTADDFERLATIFRPSWKLDDAPFTAGASFSQDQIRALQGSASANGAHVSPIVVLEDAPITAPVRAPSAPPAAAGQDAAGPSQAREGVAVALPGTRTTTSSWPPRGAEASPAPPVVDPAALPPAQRPTVPSWTAEGAPSTRPSQRPDVPSWTEDGRSPFSPPALIPAGAWATAKSGAKTEILRRDLRSQKPMWLGLGAAAVIAGVGIWIWTSSGPAPSPTVPTEAKTVVQAPVAQTPPPTASVAASVSAGATAVPEPPPRQEPPPTTTAPSPPPPAVTEAAPNPVAAPPPTIIVPKPVPAPAPPVAVSPAPKPAVRPRPAAQTIVHDVPF